MLTNLENIQCLKKENSNSIEIRDHPTVPKINEAKDISQKYLFMSDILGIDPHFSCIFHIHLGKWCIRGFYNSSFQLFTGKLNSELKDMLRKFGGSKKHVTQYMYLICAC